MDAHSETATVEAPVAEQPTNALESLPEQSTESNVSFIDAIENAFNPKPEPTPEPVSEEPSKQEAQPEAQAEEQATAKDVKEVTEEVKQEVAEDTSSEDGEPVESLTEDLQDWTPKAANRFKELKSELKNNRSELEELRQLTKEQTSQLMEMASLVEDRDIDALKEKVSKYEEQQAFTDLEATEAYKEVISEPLNAILDQAIAISDHYDVEGDVIIDIMSLDNPELQDQALDQHFPDMSARDKAKVYRMIEDIEPILAQRQEMYENVDVALNEAKALEEEKMNNELAEKVRIRQSVSKNVVQRVKEKLPFITGLEGVDLDGIQEKASSLDPAVVHPVDFAYGSVAGDLLPRVVQEFFTLQKENENLLSKLAEYEDAEPTMSGAPVGEGKAKSSGIRDNMTFEEAISAAFGG